MEAYKILHHIFHVTNWICFNQDSCIKTVFWNPSNRVSCIITQRFMEHLQV